MVVSVFCKMFSDLTGGHMPYAGALHAVGLVLSTGINVFYLKLVKGMIIGVRILCAKTLFIGCC